MLLPLQSLVSTFLQSDADWRKRLVQEWAVIVGDLHTKMRLERINQDATLIVGVYDIHWMQELHMLSPLILQTIHEKLGAVVIKKIRFIVVDEETMNKQDQKLQKKKQGLDHHLVPLTMAQQKALADIKDPALQAALAKLWRRSKQ
jgi:hypothetical protein